MNKSAILAVGAWLCCAVSAWSWGASTPNELGDADAAYKAMILERVQGIYPKLVIDNVERSEIPNVAEIYAGGKVIYFSPDKNILVFGELYDSTGTSLTQKKVGEYTVKKLGSIDKSATVQYGQGENEVIAFVNPYCGYCKKAYEWFDAQKIPGLKQYVYLVPTPGSADAKNRAMSVLCAAPADRQKALLDSFDSAHSVAETSCQGGEQRLIQLQSTAASLGITATPTFVVNGTVIVGFAPEKIEAALKTHSRS